jgi:SET domain-containing protein
MIRTKKEIIQSINSCTKTCLKPSKVCDGVGVFALIDIKNGEEIFPDLFSDSIHIEWKQIKSEVIKNYLNNLCNTDDKGLYISRSPNEINVSYYVNHSNNPNVYHNLLEDKYYAIQDIHAGEEILCLYTEGERKEFN